MSNRSSWYRRARQAIDPVIEQAQADGASPAETKRRLREAYPFGEREHWPYKAWLAAQRDALAEVGLAEPRQCQGVIRSKPADDPTADRELWALDASDPRNQ